MSEQKNKYVFTLQFIHDADYDGGLTTYPLLSSFDNNKLTTIRDGLKKELETFFTEYIKSDEEVCKRLGEEHNFKGGQIPENIRPIYQRERAQAKQLVYDKFPLMNKYFNGVVCEGDTDDSHKSFFFKISRTKMYY